MLGSDSQCMIDDYQCGAVDVGFVFKPLPVAHLGTEPQKEQAASERRIIAQELADESQRGTSVRISQPIDFFLYAHRILMFRTVLPEPTIIPCTRRVPHFGVFVVFLHFVVSWNQ